MSTTLVYSQIPGPFTQKSLYDSYLSDALPNQISVEVGGYLGKCCLYFCTAFSGAGKNLRHYVVDNFDDSGSTIHPQYKNNRHAKLLDNTSSVSSLYTLLNNTSEIASQNFLDRSIDFVYINKLEYSYATVLSDLQYWYPKVKGRGMFCGRGWKSEPVKSALKDYFKITTSELLALNIEENRDYYGRLVPSISQSDLDYSNTWVYRPKI